MTDEDNHQDQRKQPLNERLTEMIRGKRKNIFDVLFTEEELSKSNLRPICIQYNLRQKPKSSLGIAFYNIRTRNWFAIQPRHTIEMRMIIRGSFTESTLPLILEQIYDEELSVLTSLESPDTFQELFDTYYGTPLKEDFHGRLAREFWSRDWRIIREQARKCAAYRRERGFEVSQWIFPKGRPLEGEEPFNTAKREVEEETGIRILFENPHSSSRNLNRGGGAGKSYTQEDPFEFESPMRTGFWEPCHIDFPDEIEELTPGFICKEFVSQLHSDISGRVYKTTLWICVFDLETNPEIPLSPQNYESRGGMWLSEERLRSQSRVLELFHRCDSLLTKYYPYLMV
jgi:8-oxo-dGTP pyrophosphatase MutT (NUDIX family)